MCSCNWLDKVITIIVLCVVVVGVCVVGKYLYEDRYGKSEAVVDQKRK